MRKSWSSRCRPRTSSSSGATLGVPWLHIYDAFYKQDTIKHVLVRHEQAAVHAADGYARATGEVGVALVTSGPGVTNAVTGIATAYMDSIPMVIVTGQVPTPAIGPRCVPGVRHRWHHPADRQAQLPGEGCAPTGRSDEAGLPHRAQRPPGPGGGGHPEDVSFNKTTYSGYPQSVAMRSYNPVRKGHGGQIRKALQLLLAAKRPFRLRRAVACCWPTLQPSCALWSTRSAAHARTP